ncbi:hypothetical protein SCP_0305180 [Sparassis crispa]|uniref:Aminotransferase class V domain-containing protein n=1 Tax=Sparassis crispa TaxID=139825 RepID=A0A401GF51_9APHY|nr:hypothetical protein SCP_0305180 [Sparassis crispa]GBE80798.1 hypothetical protein SCP_0305180 [Sparassis crispa]
MFSLTDHPVDAMAVSFYKMFGYPTGIGALIAKEEFLAQLDRPWFAGGTVDVVQVPGMNVTMSSHQHERFEVRPVSLPTAFQPANFLLQDGTINYLNLSVITEGLRFLSAYLPFLPLRLSSLTSYLVSSLSQLRHESTGTPVVRVLSRVPSRQLTAIGEQSDTGSTVSVVFLFVGLPYLT